MKIKNWSKFQHFKDRRPPWIKLYRDILDDIEWHELDPKAAKVLIMIWLIASEDDGNIPDLKKLSFRLRMSEKDTQVCISKLSHWVDQDDIGVISDRYQDDAPETETETEEETEVTHDLATARSSPAAPVSEIVEMYNRILPMLPQVTVVSDSRKRLIAARWREVVTTDKLDRNKGLEFFEWFFKHVSHSKFLTGRSKDWKANFEFLFTASKFPRIVEGAYHEDKK